MTPNCKVYLCIQYNMLALTVRPLIDQFNVIVHVS